MYQAFALAFGLAMDATAVSAARGFTAQRREAFILPLLFGLFQAGMSALGWVGGAALERYMDGWDRWVACVALAAIGLKMLVDGIRHKGQDEEKPGTSVAVYLGLAIATSLDAAAAGISLPQLPVAPAISLALIGAVTWLLSVAGYVAGRTAGAKIGGKLAIVGGVVLIAIGVRLVIA